MLWATMDLIRRTRHLNKVDRDQQLRTLANNFNNLTLATYMEPLLPFYE